LIADRICGNLELGDDGIWFSKKRSRVSYPSTGNETCYLIEDESFWFRHRNHCILECMRAYPPTGAVFDVGGGNGFVSLGMQNSGYEPVLVEPGLSGAHNAKSRGLADVICSTLEDAGFPARSLPAIGIFDVVEHIDDQRRFLCQLRELLRPGGRIYVTVPAYRWLWSSDDVFSGHFRRYTRASLIREMNRSGFDVEFSSYFFAGLPLPVLFARTLPGRFGLRNVAETHGGAREHLMLGGLRTLVDALFAWERKAIANRCSIPFGSSCLLVARAQ
jgi:SAM-dependent methyltransferase